MEAKVKQEHPWKEVTAFAGREYVKSEWRPVPAGKESAALVHPFLETRGNQKAAVAKAKTVELPADQTPANTTTTEQAPAPKKGGKKVLTPEEEKAKKDEYNANRKAKRAAEKLAKAQAKLDAVAKKAG